MGNAGTHSDERETVPDTADMAKPSNIKLLLLGLWLSLFLSALDTTITTTALVPISDEFQSSDMSGWVLNAYLLTYSSLLLIAAKFSDVIGFRVPLIIFNLMFTGFSIACGVATSMIQLIVFRAFQGLGGSGIYSLVFALTVKIADAKTVGFYTAVLSSVFAVASLLGPVLGGIISQYTTWRWIFYLNGPIGVLVTAILWYTLLATETGNARSRNGLKGFDMVGGLLSIAWPILLVYALQEGGVHYGWRSSVAIGTVVGGFLGLIVFAMYEYWLDSRNREPVFPMRFFRNPQLVFMFLVAFLSATSYVSSLVLLSQRFQYTNASSAMEAGFLLLGFVLTIPTFSVLAGWLMQKSSKSIPYLLVGGSCLVVIGSALLSVLDTGLAIPKSVFGAEILLGAGLGLLRPASFALLKDTVTEADTAAATGALNTFLTIGYSLGVAVAYTILQFSLRSKLLQMLPSDLTAQILSDASSISTLPSDLTLSVRRVFGQSYNEVFPAMTGLAGANVLISVLSAVYHRRNILEEVSP